MTEPGLFLRVIDPKSAIADNILPSSTTLAKAVQGPPPASLPKPPPGKNASNQDTAQPTMPPTINPASNPHPSTDILYFRDDLGPSQESEWAYLYINNQKAGQFTLDSNNKSSVISVPATEQTENYQIKGLTTDKGKTARLIEIAGSGKLFLGQGRIYHLHAPPPPAGNGHNPRYYWFSLKNLMPRTVSASSTNGGATSTASAMSGGTK